MAIAYFSRALFSRSLSLCAHRPTGCRRRRRRTVLPAQLSSRRYFSWPSPPTHSQPLLLGVVVSGGLVGGCCLLRSQEPRERLAPLRATRQNFFGNSNALGTPRELPAQPQRQASVCFSPSFARSLSSCLAPVPAAPQPQPRRHTRTAAARAQQSASRRALVAAQPQPAARQQLARHLSHSASAKAPQLKLERRRLVLLRRKLTKRLCRRRRHEKLARNSSSSKGAERCRSAAKIRRSRRRRQRRRPATASLSSVQCYLNSQSASLRRSHAPRRAGGARLRAPRGRRPISRTGLPNGTGRGQPVAARIQLEEIEFAPFETRLTGRLTISGSAASVCAAPFHFCAFAAAAAATSATPFGPSRSLANFARIAPADSRRANKTQPPLFVCAATAAAAQVWPDLQPLPAHAHSRRRRRQ